MVPRLPGVAVVAICLASPALAQTLPQATNVAALQTFPTFYTDRPIAVRGQLRERGGVLTLEDAGGHRVLALARDGSRPDGLVEATGQLWDLGRMKQDDGRLTGYEVAPVVKASGSDWPRPGDVFVFALTGTSAVDSTGTVNTVRSLVLEGAGALGRLVTVSGQFRGRNLYGDLPRSPGVSPWDFVLRASGAAIWVTGIQPRGKNFDLDAGKRVDTDRWLRVSGIVRASGGLMWIEAKSVNLAERETDAPANAAAAAPPPVPAPEVLFSVPAQGETDVKPETTVRIQLSRDLDPESLKGRIRVSYVGVPNPQAAATPPPVKMELDERERVLTLRFDQPLERWRTVRVELTDGIVGTDKQPLKPWSLTFTVGG